MRRLWVIVGAWSVLLVSALLIGVMAFRLLGKEEERVTAVAREAVAARVRTVASAIDLALSEMQDTLLERLREMNGRELAGALGDWKERNPLIRNVFVWEAGYGLILPSWDEPRTQEEESFARRFNALFAGRAAWERIPQAAGEAADGPVESYAAPLRELRELAAGRSESAAPGMPSTVAVEPVLSGGWTPWYADDQLTVLGWVEVEGGNRRYGAEAEMMAVLARLLPLLPQQPPEGQAYAILDGSGKIFSQTGGTAAGDLETLATSVVGSRLPHWSVAVFGDSKRILGTGSRRAEYLSFVLVGTFVAAILFGGSLLLWQAYRNALDARKKTTFVSNVSHELKTPLTTIRMYGELLREGAIRDEEKLTRYLDVISGESERLTRLVNNALDFSRLEQGRKTYTLQEIRLEEMLGTLLDAHALRLEDAGMRLVRHIPAGIFPVRSDRDALGQTFLNLLDNAAKYGADGGELLVELAEEHEGYRVSFSDRGPGVPRVDRMRVFDKFFRGDDSLTTRQPGSGLGLSIARQLMRGIGGDLVCREREGGGARFDVMIPREGNETS